MELIDREALKKELSKSGYDKADFGGLFFIIDNAPTVEPFERIGSICEENCGYRPQGKCKDCKYFEKSLCENAPYGWCLIRRATQEGDLETQVPKDYYCSWFEKGGAE